ncbi:hypothetical protein ACROYT_G030924 [Oculina patagonica]
MNQAASLEENCPPECSPTDDATADELFDSFMEIANDPELHNAQEDTQNGTTGEAIAASDPSVSSQLKDSNADEQKDSVSRTHDQEETETSSDPSVSQPKDTNSSSDERKTDIQTETNEQSETIETDKKSTPSGTPDHSETTVEESSDPAMSQVKNVNSSANAEKVDSAGSNPATAQSNSDGNPVQNATEVPAEGSEKVLANPVSDESKSEPEELSVTTDTVQSSSDVKNEVDRTEELSCGTKNLEKGSESSEIPVAGNKEISPDQMQHGVDCTSSSDDKEELPSGNDETDVAKRLSKAMEDLAGLEQQLSSAVMELKQSTGENTFAETGDEKELNAETQEGQTLETQPEGQVASQTNVTDTKETQVENELVENKLVTDEGSNVSSAQDNGENATVCETDADLNDSNNEETLVENTDINNKDAINDDCKGTDVDVVKVQEVKMENDKSGESDRPVPAKEDLNESNVMGTSETPERDLNAGQEDGSKVPVGTVELQAETKVEESKNGEEKVSIDKSDSTDELDKEVVKCMSIPDIEITTDESENKSLDSIDTEGSSNSPPASPAFSDDGVDSDTPSDYGDDDDGTFEPINLEASRRKSWLLETDRDRLSSDSSTVSEKDFKDSFNKGDNADGKSPKEDYIRGHLLKMGGSGLTPKNWRKRWFVLRGDNCLYYYKQSKDKVPCGVIILANYSVSKAPEISKSHCFKLTKGGARTYYMCAGSDSDMKKWIMAMMDAIKGSSGSSNPFNLSEGNVHNVSIPALSIRDPDCHGYLYKQGHSIKTWRRRYFVLKNGFLYYYSDMSNTVALGVAKLLHYTIQLGDQSGKKFCFSATSTDPASRTYFFAAESEMDRTRWSSRLEDSIKKGSLVS